VVDYERKRQQFQLSFDRDGGFRIADVPPGRYELRLRALRPLTKEESASGRYVERPEIASLTREIIVPPGDAASVVDLGTFEVEAKTTGVPPAPPIDFQITTTDGKPLSLASLRGQPVVVTFWASWAPLSGRRLAEIKAAAPAGARLLGVNLDDNAAAAKTSLERIGEGWTHSLAAGPARFNLTEQLGIDTLPAVLVLDANGSIVARDPGSRRIARILGRHDRKTAQP
jgi:hypothetical protein